MIIALDDTINLVIVPDSSSERLAKRSRFALLRRVERAIVSALSRCDPFEEWLARCVEQTDVTDLVEQDALFVSYFSFCKSLKLTGADRLNFTEFDRRLSHEGFELVCGEDGIAGRHGLRLHSNPIPQTTCDGPADIGSFLDEVCVRHGDQARGKIRVGALFNVYLTWAERSGEPKLCLRDFSRALSARGLAKKRSNGMWCKGIELRRTVTSDCPRAPSLGDLFQSVKEVSDGISSDV